MAKLIHLAGPTTIGDRIVTPIEGPQLVSDEQAADLKTHSLIDGEPEDAPDALLPPERPKAPRGKAADDTATRRQASERR